MAHWASPLAPRLPQTLSRGRSQIVRTFWYFRWVWKCWILDFKLYHVMNLSLCCMSVCHLQVWISYRFGDVLEYIFKNKYRKVTYFAILFYLLIFKIYITLYCKIVLLVRKNKFGWGKPFLPFTKHIAKPIKNNWKWRVE